MPLKNVLPKSERKERRQAGVVSEKRGKEHRKTGSVPVAAIAEIGGKKGGGGGGGGGEKKKARRRCRFFEERKKEKVSAREKNKGKKEKKKRGRGRTVVGRRPEGGGGKGKTADNKPEWLFESPRREKKSWGFLV